MNDKAITSKQQVSAIVVSREIKSIIKNWKLRIYPSNSDSCHVLQNIEPQYTIIVIVTC